MMAEKKDKKSSTKEEAPRKSRDEIPKLVEVYGKDVEQKREKAKGERTKEKFDDEKKSKDSEGVMQDKEKTSDRDVVEEILEDRQTLKTEVVGKETINLEPKTENETDKEKPILKTEIEKDEIAFENEIGTQRSAVKGVFGIGVFVFLIIFGLTGWAFYLKSVWLPKETVSEVVVEATPSPVSESTPKPIIEQMTREEILIDVLNGSGISGLAGKTAETFEDLGYEIGNVANASSAEENELYIKEDKLDVLGTLYEDVLEELEISSPSGYLDSDEDVVARIVLGS